MKLPAEVLEGIERAVGSVTATESVGGGCISSTSRIRTADAEYFLKYDPAAPPSFFEVEAAGLEALSGTHANLKIPSVAAVSDGSADECGWILLEWLEGGGRKTMDASAALGRALAELHRGRVERWGWHRDGYIGSLPQSNRWHRSWTEFWWEERLEPQLERARVGTQLRGSGWPDLARVLPDLLAVAEADGPSLLHGDLWNGNVLFTPEGPALIDPAVYYGHREVDLAMAALFGGFDRSFFAAYDEAWPLQPGSEIRRGVYQLYYLLVHVNLFGASYVAGTEATLRTILSQTGARSR